MGGGGTLQQAGCAAAAWPRTSVPARAVPPCCAEATTPETVSANIVHLVMNACQPVRRPILVGDVGRGNCSCCAAVMLCSLCSSRNGSAARGNRFCRTNDWVGLWGLEIRSWRSSNKSGSFLCFWPCLIAANSSLSAQVPTTAAARLSPQLDHGTAHAVPERPSSSSK